MEEKSAGAVVYRTANTGNRVYLLLLNLGRWDFPKGNMETSETELQTAIREVGEETGLHELVIRPGFRRVIEYFYRRGGKNIHKHVIYLLAETKTGDVKISSEHQAYGWFPYNEAIARASYDNSKKLLHEAEGFLARYAGGDRPMIRTERAGASRPV